MEALLDQASYGCEDEGGFNAVSKAYKADPSLETYVRLRRSNPTAELEVAVIGGFESMFYMRREFERYGLDPELLGGLLDADPNAIGEIALSVMEAVIEAGNRERAGETHIVSRGEVIPPKLVDWIICCTLDALSWNDRLTIPRDLIVLIRERLGGSNPLYEQIGHIREMKSNAGMVAGQLKAQGVTPTFKLVGQILGVAASTVMRWFEPGEFEREAEKWERLCDETGVLHPLKVKAPLADIAPDS
jgi:hypothetical protein